MKTLDEVIKALRICDETVTANCPDCPYDLDCENVPREDLKADALHYLWEYQKILPLVPSLINTALAVQKKGKTIK